MARKNCYRCPKNMAHQCNLDFGLDGCPPCAEAVESAPSTDVQQLKPKMPTLDEVVSYVNGKTFVGSYNGTPSKIELAYDYICRHFGH